MSQKFDDMAYIAITIIPKEFNVVRQAQEKSRAELFFLLGLFSKLIFSAKTN